MIELENAFTYQGQRMRVRHRKGDNEAADELRLGLANPFAAEIDHFAERIRENEHPHTGGAKGLRDHVIMAAIYRSVRENVPIKLDRA